MPSGSTTVQLPASIAELTAQYRLRALSPVEVTRALLAEAERTQPRLNAFIAITADQALAQARQAERRLLRGEQKPLLGVPVTLKDLIDQRDVVTTGGSAAYRNLAAADATVARRLFRAGAISLGKTNLHEVAFGVSNDNPHFGPVRNPWGPERVSGGSSGGAAAAVAVGIGYAGIGTDTGGSIRIPAALCGVVGLKPTYGRVPATGVMPLSRTLDHVGPLTRSVADAAIVLRAIAGPAGDDPTSSQRRVPDYLSVLDTPIAGLRIGIIEEDVQAAAPSVARAVEAALETLASLGAKVSRVSLPWLASLNPLGALISGAEAAAFHRAALAERPDRFGADVRHLLEGGLGVPAVDYLAALERAQQARRTAADLFAAVGLLAGPTTMRPAEPIATARAARVAGERPLPHLLSLTRPFNVLGLPAISVPCGFDDQGLPIGLQLVGRAFDEATVLRAAHAYEQATDWHACRPPEPSSD